LSPLETLSITRLTAQTLSGTGGATQTMKIDQHTATNNLFRHCVQRQKFMQLDKISIQPVTLIHKFYKKITVTKTVNFQNLQNVT